MFYNLKNVVRILKERGPLGLLRKFNLYVRFTFILSKTRQELHAQGVLGLVDFAYFACSGLIKPFQEKEEITKLLKIVSHTKPSVIMEIGTAVGGNLFLFCQIAAEDATIISVDLPGGKFGGGYPIWRKFLYKFFPFGKQRLSLIRGDSHADSTRRKIRGIMKDKQIDFLFIDGDHTYEGVKKDFNMYGPFVRTDGLIAFHDIVPHQKNSDCGVDRFWQEIKLRYDSVEIVRNWDQQWAGIGLIRKK